MPERIPVLLIEDSGKDADLIRRAFADASIADPLVVVHTAEEALRYLTGEGRFGDRGRFPLPRIILLDLKLPGRDGFWFLEWIRTKPSLQSVRVIVLAGSESVFDLHHAYQLGAASYVLKPVNFAGLVEVMNALKAYWLEHNRDAPPSPLPAAPGSASFAVSAPTLVVPPVPPTKPSRRRAQRPPGNRSPKRSHSACSGLSRSRS